MTHVIGTLQGDFAYEDLVPQLALGVQRVMKELAAMPPEDLHFSSGFICDLHRNAFGRLVDWAGQKRRVDVQIRAHTPPDWVHVPRLLDEYAYLLERRASLLDAEDLNPHELAALFAYAEGRFTHIHPFQDFNGRVSRLISWCLVLRFRLSPSLELVPPPGDAEAKRVFFEALAAYDQGQHRPLEELWLGRLWAMAEEL